jgi:hypothetical protein
MSFVIIFSRAAYPDNTPPAPKAKPDGFWITGSEKAVAQTSLRACLALQAEMEKQSKELMSQGGFEKARYSLMPNGKSGAIIFE